MSNEVVLTGANSGVRVIGSPTVAAAWQQLTRARQAQNYWATLIVKQIRQLSAGRLSNDYAYVKNVPSN